MHAVAQIEQTLAHAFTHTLAVLIQHEGVHTHLNRERLHHSPRYHVADLPVLIRIGTPSFPFVRGLEHVHATCVQVLIAAVYQVTSGVSLAQTPILLTRDTILREDVCVYVYVSMCTTVCGCTSLHAHNVEKCRSTGILIPVHIHRHTCTYTYVQVYTRTLLRKAYTVIFFLYF